MFIVDFLALLLSDLVTVSPQSHVTEEGLIDLTATPTTGLSTTDTSVTWTTSMGTDVTDDSPNPSSVTITAGERTTSFANPTHISVTSSPATHSDPHHLNSSHHQEINPTHSLNTSTFSDQSVVSNLSTTLGHDSAVFRNESMGSITENSDNRGATTLSTGNSKKENKGNNYLLFHN